MCHQWMLLNNHPQVVVALPRRWKSTLVIPLEDGDHLLQMTMIIFGQHFLLILAMYDLDVAEQRRKTGLQRGDVTGWGKKKRKMLNDSDDRSGV